MKIYRVILIKRIILMLIFALLITSTVIYSERISTLLHFYHLLPQREPFTELYFEHASKLPTSNLVNIPVSFSFTVHNLEYRAETYPVEVSIVINQKKQVIDKQSFSLPQNGYKTTTEAVVLPNSNTRSEVVVALPTKKLQIDFYIGGGSNGK